MTVEIVEVRSISLGVINARQAEIIITSGPNSYLWSAGGLPLTGDLQAILEAREAELFAQAQTAGRPVDLYELATKRVLKAFALVVLDELNILRTRAGLANRTAGMIDDAIKAKLKAM